MNTIRRWRRALARRAAAHGESGQALAEIAIALPLLLLMLIGIWEFARAYQIQQVVVNAAREGAREVVLPTLGTPPDETGTIASATTAVNAYLAGGSVPCPSPPCVTFSPADETAHTTGDPITVEVRVPYRFVFIGPAVRLATGGNSSLGDIELSSRATMRHE